MKKCTSRTLRWGIPSLAVLAAVLAVQVAGGQEDGGLLPGSEPKLGGQELEEQASVPDDAMVVEVDGRTLTHGELESQVRQFMQSRGGNLSAGAGAATADVAKQMVEGFVARTLLLNQAEEQGIEVSEDDVNAVLDSLRSQLPPDASLDVALRQIGLSEQELRENIERDLKIKQLIDRQTDELPAITDEKVQTFYDDSAEQFRQSESVSARHILIQVDPDAPEAVREEKRKKAEALRQQLIDGTDFAELAREHSEGPSASRGGDLGAFGRGQMVPAFEEAAFSQDVNEIGPVVETQFGYHIIQVQERQEARTRSLDEVREDIVSYLESRRAQSVIEDYVETLRQGAEITYGPAAPE